MNDIVLGLLGGGVLVQLLNILFTFRQNRRQLNASALGGEVEALERTIKVLSDNLVRETARHNEESERLRAQIRRLEQEVVELREQLGAIHRAASVDEGDDRSQ